MIIDVEKLKELQQKLENSSKANEELQGQMVKGWLKGMIIGIEQLADIFPEIVVKK